jgi:hypothetical protein
MPILNASLSTGGAASSASAADISQVHGVLLALCMLYKYAPREALIEVTDVHMPVLCKHVASENMTVRKLSSKLLQRCGMVLLKPRDVAWKYKLATKILLADGSEASAVGSGTDAPAGHSEDDETLMMDGDPSHLEHAINTLLTLLKDASIVVRYSAAKGLSRILARLPLAYANEVLESLFAIFDEDVLIDIDAWHGTLLALSELVRRGLCPLDRVPLLLNVLRKSFFVDVPKGTFSVGSICRDASCYLAWSIARSYTSDDLQSCSVGLGEMGKQLVALACTDREVNIRRAASAAFQELVGRQSALIAKGIAILTVADYYTVSSLANVYAVVSSQVAEIDAEYGLLIADRLSDKVGHWDPDVRALVGEAFKSLLSVQHSQVRQAVSAKIATYAAECGSDARMDVVKRHGMLLSLASTISVANLSLQPPAAQNLLSLLPALDSQRVFKGKHGEILRAAVCNFIASLVERFGREKGGPELTAATTVPIMSQLTKKTMQVGVVKVAKTIVFECIRHPTEEISFAGVKALAAMYRHIAFSDADIMTDISPFVAALTSHSPDILIRRPAPMVLAQTLPVEFFSSSGKQAVLDALAKGVSVEDVEDSRDAESRRNAATSVGDLVSRVGGAAWTESDVESLFSALMLGSVDYSTDKRGDVGSWVREASLRSAGTVYCACRSVLQTNQRSEEALLGAIIRQCADRIDRTRAVAVRVLVDLLSLSPPFPARPFSLGGDGDYFGNAASVYPYLQGYLADHSVPATVRSALVEGWVNAMGGLSEHVSRAASDTLFAYFASSETSADAVNQVVTDFLSVGEQQQQRLVVPLLKSLEIILVHPRIVATLREPARIVDLVKNLIKTTSDPVRLFAAIKVLCNLVSFDRNALSPLLFLLANRFPKVRRVAAEEVYSLLLVQDELMDAALASDVDVLDVLSSTQWDSSDVDSIRKARDNVYEGLGVEKPKTVVKTDVQVAKVKKDTGYKELVREMGY